MKVTLPWMADDVESDWARVVTPMAGAERGLYFLPEVDDEVLVAFEHGSPDAPVRARRAVERQGQAAGDQRRRQERRARRITSRSGHVIRLTDTEGEEQIEIVDSSGKNSIVISTKDKTITISADADITIKPPAAS